MKPIIITLSSVLGIIALAIGMAGCAMPVEPVGEESAAVTTAHIHGTNVWWQPPEWHMVGSGTLVNAWQVGENTPTEEVPAGTAFHCGSLKFPLIAGGCQGAINITVTGGWTFGFLDPTPMWVYWQQPGGGAWTIISLGTIMPSPDGFGWSHLGFTLGGANPVTGVAWTGLDIGCGGPPPISGICVAGDNQSSIYLDEDWLQATYTPVKQ